jgi:hypothetical protein
MKQEFTRSFQWGAGFLGVMGAMAIVAQGCGKPADSDSVGSRVIPVEGRAWFRTECQDGGVGDPYPRPLELWKCNIPVDRIALAQDLPELTILGDCHKNTITVRRNGKSESWELMRNLDYSSNFDIDINDFPSTTLRDDGRGAANCIARLSLNLFGKMRCQPGADARYKADIDVEAVWWVNKSLPAPSPTPSPTPSPSPSPTRTSTPRPSPTPAPTTRVSLNRATVIDVSAEAVSGGGCNLPAQCYFYSFTNIRQCR